MAVDEHMKITLTKVTLNSLYFGPASGSVENSLFQHLYFLAYSHNHNHPGPTSLATSLGELNYVRVNLSEMAKLLRAQNWCVYYWRDKQGMELNDFKTQIIHEVEEGLIVAAYCGNLTAWLLTHT
jgi:hypothetical protein